MTTPFDYYKIASDQALIDLHKHGVVFSGGTRMTRRCQKCDVVQPDNVSVNTPCVACQCPVVLWVPVEGK